MPDKMQEKIDYYEFLIDFVSHEIRNPLSAVIMFAQLLREGKYGPVPDQQQCIVDRILANAARIEHMTDDFLNLNRIEGKGHYLNKERLDLHNDIVKPAINSLQKKHLFTQEEKKAFKQGNPSSVIVDADRDLISVVFDNLFFNAIKYGREGGEIRYDWKDEGDHILISIINEGQGVQEEELKLIFKKFVRLRDVNVPSRRGTGLGLYNVKKIIEMHGGHSWAKSNYGQDFTLYFTLPKQQS